MLATEEHPAPDDDRGAHSNLLESHAGNERMRHIPSAEWMEHKLESGLRRQIERLWLAYNDLPFSDPRHPSLEAEFRTLCRWLDRVADCARRHRGHSHSPADLGSRVVWSIHQASTALHTADPETFGKRFPVQTLERSNAEPLWAAMLAVIQHVHRLIDLIREIDPDIDEAMYEGLVQLQTPLRREPIA